MRYLAIGLLVLTACVHTPREAVAGSPGIYRPPETVEGGTRTDFVSRNPVDLTATCLARRVHERTGLVAHVRSGDAAEVLDVVVRMAGRGDPFSVLRVEPRGSGSFISVWVAPVTSGAGATDFAAFLSEGC